MSEPATGDLAMGGSGLSTPGVAVLALAAKPKGSIGDSITRALATPLLGENEGDSEIVHPNLPSLGAIRLVRIGGNERYEQSAAGSEDAVTTR